MDIARLCCQRSIYTVGDCWLLPCPISDQLLTQNDAYSNDWSWQNCRTILGLKLKPLCYLTVKTARYYGQLFRRSTRVLRKEGVKLPNDSQIMNLDSEKAAEEIKWINHEWKQDPMHLVLTTYCMWQPLIQQKLADQSDLNVWIRTVSRNSTQLSIGTIALVHSQILQGSAATHLRRGVRLNFSFFHSLFLNAQRKNIKIGQHLPKLSQK